MEGYEKNKYILVPYYNNNILAPGGPVYAGYTQVPRLNEVSDVAFFYLFLLPEP